MALLLMRGTNSGASLMRHMRCRVMSNATRFQPAPPVALAAFRCQLHIGAGRTEEDAMGKRGLSTTAVQVATTEKDTSLEVCGV